jgi:tetratricopeptide (TPR) repeat protein
VWFAVLVNATTFWEWSATAAKDVLGVIGFALLAAAVIFFLWCGLAYTVRKWKRTRERWIARLWNPPDLAVIPLDDTGFDKKMGTAVATLVRGHVNPQTVGSLTAVTGHTTVTESLKSLGEISDEAKAAAGLVSFFLGRLPNRHFEASGALQIDGLRGQGITVELNNQGDQLESRTLWADEFGKPDEFKDDASAFQFLAIPAAAWIEHRLAARLHTSKGMPDEAEVWMLFNAGLDWQQRGENPQARWLYEKALAKDPYDSWSTSNLGRIQLEDGEYAKAEKSLTRALEGLESDGVAIPAPINPDWYRVKYNLAELHWE